MGGVGSDRVGFLFGHKPIQRDCHAAIKCRDDGSQLVSVGVNPAGRDGVGKVVAHRCAYILHGQFFKVGQGVNIASGGLDVLGHEILCDLFINRKQDLFWPGETAFVIKALQLGVAVDLINDASQFIPENPTFPKTIEIAQTDPNFKFQQVWKSNLGLDQRIGNRLIASGEVLFTKNINAPVYFNANLEPATTNFAGPDDRLRFNGGGLNTGTPKDDTTRINNNISTAVVLDNVNEGYYFGVTGLLEYPAVNNRGFYGKVGYTYSRTKDLQSAGSIAAGSWTNSFSVNGNNNLELSFSDNDTPHRIFGLMGYTIDYGGKWGGATSISLGYIGQRSGRVSYAYAGDMNGDNVSNNDLIYVPNSASELNFQSYSVNYVVTDASGNTSTVTKTFTVDEQVAAFDAFIDQDEYLSTRRGRYAERNGGLFPWLHRFDLSIMQEVFLRTGREDKDRNSLQFRVDILNFGNLLNDSWGVGKTLLTNRVLSYRSLNADGEPVYRFGTQTINGVPELQQNTFINSTNVSNVWQAQFGLRYTFGR